MEYARPGASSWWCGKARAGSCSATTVVTWDPGEWVEYGTNAGEGWKTESYWAEDLSEEEWKAVFAEAFGPDAVADWHT